MEDEKKRKKVRKVPLEPQGPQVHQGHRVPPESLGSQASLGATPWALLAPPDLQAQPDPRGHRDLLALKDLQEEWTKSDSEIVSLLWFIFKARKLQYK